MKIVKVFTSLVSVALFGASLFAASVAVSQQADGQVQYNAPQNHLIPAGGGVRVIDTMLMDPTPGRTVRCENISAQQASPLASITRSGCTYTFTSKSTSTNGQSYNNIICFRSYVGTSNTVASQQCINWRYRIGPASSVTFNAPTGLRVAAGGTLVVNALSYATETDSRYSITCGDATGIDTTELSSVTRSGCMFTVNAKNVRGAASFNVPYTSYGGTTTSHTINVQVVEASDISDIMFSAPASNPHVGINGSRVLDVSRYASDGRYTITCGTATESSALISISAQTGCEITVAAGSSTGTAVITVPYMSSGGDTHTAMITVEVSDSFIVFTPPDLTIQVGGALAINAASYATDGTYTVTCGEVESKSDRIASISRNGCGYIITPRSAGPAEFTITYTSSGGDTRRASIPITIEAPPPAPSTPNTESQPDYAAPADAAPADATPSGTTARADEAEETTLSWSTLTVQPGGTTARTIRQTLGLSSRRAIYAWNADTQAWTALTDPTRTIPSGVVLSFRAPAEISREDLEIANIGQGSRRTALAQGWNIITPPETTTRAADSSFLFDPSLTDCDNARAVIAIASYNAQTRQWALWLPCHPQTQRTLTTGTNPTYRTLTQINPQDTTYIYTRTAQPINIAWNPDTQTYQPAT